MKIKFTDGTSRQVDKTTAALVVGKDSAGNLVASLMGFEYPLTPCCNASGKGSIAGSGPAVVCRSCYKEVGYEFGMEATVRFSRVR